MPAVPAGAGASALAWPADTAGRQRMAAQLARTHGNQWMVARLAPANPGGRRLAREKIEWKDVAAASAEEAVKWPDSLPRANRSAAGAGLTLKMDTTTKEAKKATAPELEGQDEGGSALTDAQKSMVKFIREQREATSGLTGRLTLSKEAGGGWGWMWGDPAGAADTPTELQGEKDPAKGAEAKRRQIDEWIWRELGKEGGTIAINAYDKAKMTWGRGMAHSGGALENFMSNLPEDVKTDFLKYGIRVVGKGLEVVNASTGAVETGDDALAMIQGRKDILGGFIAVGEKHRQKIADAQWPAVKAHSGKVDRDEKGQLDNDLYEDVGTWPKPLVQLVAHVTHLGPARGTWHHWKGRRAPAGTERDVEALKALESKFVQDMVRDVIEREFKSLVKDKKEKNGAWLLSYSTQPIAEYRTWGGGIAAYWLAQNASGPIDTTAAKIIGANFMSDRFALVTNNPSGYYIWPRISGAQETELGGSKVRDLLLRANGLSMADMLKELGTLPLSLRNALLLDPGTQGAATEISEGIQGVTNEERIWWALKVLRNKQQGGGVPDVPRYKAGDKDPEGKPARPGDPKLTGDKYLLVSRDDQRTAWKFLGKEKQMPADLKDE